MFGTPDDGPVVSSPGGNLFSDLSDYAVNQDKNLDFKMLISFATPMTGSAIIIFLTAEHDPADGMQGLDYNLANNVRLSFSVLEK